MNHLDRWVVSLPMVTLIIDSNESFASYFSDGLIHYTNFQFAQEMISNCIELFVVLFCVTG